MQIFFVFIHIFFSISHSFSFVKNIIMDLEAF